MGKLVKAVVGVAIAVVGVATGNLALVAAGFSIGSSALAKKPKTPEPSRENIDRLNLSIVPNTSRKWVAGSTAMSTEIRDHEYTNDQEFLHRFVVVAAHKVHAIREVWFDEKLAWTSTGGAQGDFVGYLQIVAITEGNAGNAINISSRLGSSRRFTGLAYIHIRYKLTGNSKKSDSPFAQSITTRVTIRGDGAFMYDPRKDSTNGGSGAHRPDNQATWEWDADACRNPSIVMLFYLLGWKINGIGSVGLGIPFDRIDLASFITAANICDEPVPLNGGGTEPRYRCDGIFGDDESPTAVLDRIKACMNADLDDVGGKLRLTVFHNDLAAVQATFTDADIVGDFEWRPYATLDETFNIVRGQYTDPSDTALYQPRDYPEYAETSVDGIDRIEPFNLSHVQSPSQATRLAKLRALRNKSGGTVTTTLRATGWRVQKNSVVRLSRAGRFTDKLFRVAEMDHNIDGRVPIVLREESAAIYAWGSDEVAPSALVPTSDYNPALNPIVQGIDDAAKGVALAASYTRDLSGNIAQFDAGTNVTVQIPDHFRVYPSPFGERAVTGDDITGLSYATLYLIYYDDPAFAGGAVTYGATTTAADAYYSAAHPFRHFIGYVTTVSAGGGGGSTGGSSPPGGGGWTGGGGGPIP